GIRDFHVTGVQTCALPISDIQLFPQSREQWLAILRWDLEPGDRDRVLINVPSGAAAIAFWTAGKPVPFDGRLPPSRRPEGTAGRSEERRVGKEGQRGWAAS